MSNIILLLKKPKYFLYYLDKLGLYRLDDEIYLKMQYELFMKKKLELDNPQTFNEKIQWLKLNDRNKLYTTMVDKHKVKQYVKNIIGEEYIIPTLGVYNKFEDINFEKLPNKFVLKCTHDSGSTILCKNKEKFDIKKAKKEIKKCLQKNFYYITREWAYKNVEPKILVEKYIENDNLEEIYDYKFYCFNGKVDYVMVCINRSKGKPKFYYFDRKWNFQKDMIRIGQEVKEEELKRIKKPKNIDKMFEIAERLSNNIKFVRTDLYSINNNIYFGELTFYPNAGLGKTLSLAEEQYLSSMLKI